MNANDPDRHCGGFRVHTPLAEARETLQSQVDPLDRTESVALAAADGRVLAETVAARRDVPHYRRAAMDGYAVRSTDLTSASDRTPVRLDVAARSEASGASGAAASLPPGTAVYVHTGSAVPADADAVVPIERVEAVGGHESGEDTGEDAAGDGREGDEEDGEGHGDAERPEAVELTDPVAVGDDVAPVGEDVTDGQSLYEPGHRLRPSDLGLLKVAGVDEVAVRPEPTVGVIPTGEELVQRDPEPGQAVETNGLTVSRLVRRWGGRADYREIVTDDRDVLRAAIQRDLPKDVIVTTGGSSVGERDLLPEVVDDLGEVLVHGVALQPGHPVALGVVEDTPVLCLPGYPVSCIVTAVQFLRPVLKWLAGAPVEDHPTTTATLGRKVDSDPGTRTFARVELVEEGADDEASDGEASDEEEEDGEDDADDGLPTAEPTRARGAGVLSSVGLADGWIDVPADSEGLAAGETVAVEHWEWSA